MTRVLVGMSGGVDSSLAAALLVEQGYQVTGAYMKNWTLDVPGMQCPWAEDLAYAKRTAVRLGIDFKVYDFQDAYKRDVVDYLVSEYQAGRTPNPDIMCNQNIKFGLFYSTAHAEGFDFIATGHYARVGYVSEHTGAANVPYATPRSAAQNPSGSSCAAPPHALNENASRSSRNSVQRVASGTFADVNNTVGVPYATPRPAPQNLSASCAAPPQLLRAVDEHKDQTYFLYRIPTQALAHTIFPLGDLSKDQVRAMAAERNLPAADKPDSQGICFIGEASIQDFLRQYVNPKPGAIVDAHTGQTVGAHEGALFYTLGQRKGLGIGGGTPYLVVDKNMESNTVYVAHAGTSEAQQNLQANQVDLDDCVWIAGSPPAPGTYLVRTRHTGALAPATVEPASGNVAHVRFTKPHERVAPGQSVVVYDETVCLGGGIAR